MRLISLITLLNVLVASGFSIAGLVQPAAILHLPPGAVPGAAAHIFALYAAARTLPLAVLVLVAIYRRSAAGLQVLGLLAGIIQLLDAGVGMVQHDAGKIIGPLVLGLLQLYAVWRLRNFTPNEALISR